MVTIPKNGNGKSRISVKSSGSSSSSDQSKENNVAKSVGGSSKEPCRKHEPSSKHQCKNNNQKRSSHESAMEESNKRKKTSCSRHVKNTSNSCEKLDNEDINLNEKQASISDNYKCKKHSKLHIYCNSCDGNKTAQSNDKEIRKHYNCCTKLKGSCHRYNKHKNSSKPLSSNNKVPYKSSALPLKTFSGGVFENYSSVIPIDPKTDQKKDESVVKDIIKGNFSEALQQFRLSCKHSIV